MSTSPVFNFHQESTVVASAAKEDLWNEKEAVPSQRSDIGSQAITLSTINDDSSWKTGSALCRIIARIHQGLTIASFVLVFFFVSVMALQTRIVVQCEARNKKVRKMLPANLKSSFKFTFLLVLIVWFCIDRRLPNLKDPFRTTPSRCRLYYATVSLSVRLLY